MNHLREFQIIWRLLLIGFVLYTLFSINFLVILNLISEIFFICVFFFLSLLQLTKNWQNRASHGQRVYRDQKFVFYYSKIISEKSHDDSCKKRTFSSKGKWRVKTIYFLECTNSYTFILSMSYWNQIKNKIITLKILKLKDLRDDLNKSRLLLAPEGKLLYYL